MENRFSDAADARLGGDMHMIEVGQTLQKRRLRPPHGDRQPADRFVMSWASYF